MKKKIFKTKMK